MLRILRCLVLPFFLFFAAMPVLAFDPNGIWNADTGAFARITADSSNVTIRWDNNGRINEYRGWWIHTGETFTYDAPSDSYVGTFVNRDQIRIKSSKGN